MEISFLVELKIGFGFWLRAALGAALFFGRGKNLGREKGSREREQFLGRGESATGPRRDLTLCCQAAEFKRAAIGKIGLDLAAYLNYIIGMGKLKLKPLPKTKAALAAYDAYMDADPFDTTDEDEILAVCAEKERLGRLVGRAFGEETSSYNRVADCEALLRPGPKNPPPGTELSYLRRMCAAAPEVE